MLCFLLKLNKRYSDTKIVSEKERNNIPESQQMQQEIHRYFESSILKIQDIYKMQQKCKMVLDFYHRKFIILLQIFLDTLKTHAVVLPQCSLGPDWLQKVLDTEGYSVDIWKRVRAD